MNMDEQERCYDAMLDMLLETDGNPIDLINNHGVCDIAGELADMIMAKEIPDWFMRLGKIDITTELMRHFRALELCCQALGSFAVASKLYLSDTGCIGLDQSNMQSVHVLAISVGQAVDNIHKLVTIQDPGVLK